MRQRRLDRDLALDLLLVEVGDRVAVFDAPEPILGAARVQARRDQRRLAGIAVPDYTYVA